MNSKTVFRLVQTGALALAMMWLSGCRTTGYQKSTAASASLHLAALEVAAQHRAIDNTITALDDLVNKPAADLRPQFERFSQSLDRLIDSAQRNQRAVDRVGQRNADYFEKWNQDLAAIQFENIRLRSQERKVEVSTQANAVHRRYRETQSVVPLLIAYLEDIRTALSADLTQGGLEAVKEIARNAGENARKVQTGLERLTVELTDTSTLMSPQVAQATVTADPSVAEAR